jgi:hypothetical protein
MILGLFQLRLVVWLILEILEEFIGERAGEEADSMS